MSAYINLFGEPVAVPPKRGRHYVEPRGHAGRPGSGPPGATCGGCAHYVRKLVGSRTYPKCGLSSGVQKKHRGSDIRMRDAACQFWEADDAPES